MRNDLADWIALNMIRGIGPRTANLLLDHFGSPANVFAASREALIVEGLKPATIAQLHDTEILDKAQAEIERLDALGVQVVTLADEAYPELLREIYDPPIVLYVKGDLDTMMSQPTIAVVGSRRCSTYGINAANFLARELAAHGVTIVSGLARGIDGAAHRGAMEAGGKTIGVIGTGMDVIYPKEHKKLSEEMAANGAVVSEFPLSTPPLAQNFPYRNRVISGLCFGVLVIEASEHSGSLITARLASEQGREVFAVPGNITSQTSFGPNFLIKDGAKLVQHWRDVVEEFPQHLKESLLGVTPRPTAKESTPIQPTFEEVALSLNEQKLLTFLTTDVASHIDELLLSSGLSSPELTSALLGLEMKDRIKALPGKCFVKRL
jgi:DNA processing protein